VGDGGGQAEQFIPELCWLIRSGDGEQRVAADFPREAQATLAEQMYGTDPQNETRYSPSICWTAESKIIRGNPDRSTSTRRISSARIFRYESESADLLG